jgi:hypothetical protein
MILKIRLVFFLSSIMSFQGFSMECESFEFKYNLNNKPRSEKLKLCKVKSKRGFGFVSKNCSNLECEELKHPYRQLQKGKYRINPSKELCKIVGGAFIFGKLTSSSYSKNKSLCFFKGGKVISTGFLYERFKSNKK